jgi:DNA-directed RNA polymerase specialized sigma24 family protein
MTMLVSHDQPGRDIDLNAIIERLSERLQQVLQMSHIEDFTPDDIALLLNCTHSHAAFLVIRAHELLREEFLAELARRGR